MALNPKLLHALTRRFGEGQVRVSRAGQEAELSHQRDPLEPGRFRSSRVRSGEEYQVHCPFCGDRRQRLTISYLWGVVDETTGRKNLWLARCYNEECLSDTSNQRLLYEQVYEQFAIGQVTHASLQAGRKVQKGPVKPPGISWRLDQIAREKPDHPALRYIESRLFTPELLGQKWRVGLLLAASEARLEGRLFIPVYTQEKLITWQARAVGRPIGGAPRYLTCAGSDKSSALYGYDCAAAAKVKLLVEGPPAVWRQGDGALAVLGKTVSPQQRELIRRITRPRDIVAVALDPEQDKSTARRGQTHHLEKAAAFLEEEEELKGKVVRVWLPVGADPDDLDRRYMLDLIAASCREQGVAWEDKS